MTSPLPPEARLRAARIIHGALVTGVILFLLVMAWVRRTTTLPVPEGVASALTYGGLGALGAALLLLRMLPRPDPAPAPGQSADQWWGSSQGRLIVMWALVDGASLANGVVWFVTAERTPLVAAVVGLVVLFQLRPSRYLE